MTKLKRVVVYQYGHFWTLTRAQYADLLTKALGKDTWRLPGPGTPRRPKWVHGPVEKGRYSSCAPKAADTLFVYMPCDWDDDEIQQLAQEFR